VNSNLRDKSALYMTVVCVFHAVLLVSSATAQPQGKVLKHAGVAHLQDLEKRFGPHFSSRLSSGGANAFRLARMLSQLQSKGVSIDATREIHHEMMAEARAKLLAVGSQSQVAGGATLVPVNDRTFDYDATRFTGFTQSETSSAWCGTNIVAGFNDSAAFAHTVLLHQAAAISLSGVAVSHDRGRSFVGLPFLNPGPALNPGSPFFDSELAGDPSIVCSDPQHFVYASIQTQVPVDSQGNVIAAFAEMAVNRSSDGGVTWDDPITVAKKDLNSHFLDKEWLAVDPHNPNNMYLTYTDFQAHGTEQDCQSGGLLGGANIESGPDVSLELVASKDGGATWGAPVRFARQCGLTVFENLSGTQVVVGRRGTVYVAYTFVQDGGKLAEIRFRRSHDGGATFGPEIVAGLGASAATPASRELQGNFRTNTFPTLAVDNSAGPHSGTLYLVWTDASRHSVLDLWAGFFSNDGDARFLLGDIVISRSVDQGDTWSAAKLVSPTPATFKGAGRDQFMAGVVVDPLGNLAVCYSDRRNDRNNFLVDHYCSVSRDAGNTFRDIRETPASFTPNTFTDIVINPAYMGDYDTVSADPTGANAGFFSTFQIVTRGNPDVFGFELQ
jgi:hypothetical protein